MAATTRTECAGCGGSLKIVLDLGSSPLADHFPASPGEDGPAYPLRMAACTDCGLAQLLDLVDDAELFGASYGFHTSGSPALVSYYRDWAKWALKEFRPKFVVDIGCNDGTLLQNFRAAGCKVLGVDPAGPASVAAAADIPVLRTPWGVGTAGTVYADYGAPDLITGINVAAHVRDPYMFLRGIEGILAPGGHAVIEFQDLEHLAAGCQFDHVYHEHRFFYTVSSFAQLAKASGLSVTGLVPTQGQGGSIRAVLRKDADPRPLRLIPPMASLHQLEALQERAEYTRAALWRELGAAMERGTVAGYGATAKSATLLNFCKIGAAQLDYVEDATREKWGRFTPGTHIPITAPGQRAIPRTYLLLAWNFLGPVLRRERGYFAQGGKFIVPIPVPVTI